MESWLKIICILYRYRKQIHDIYERKQRLIQKYKKKGGCCGTIDQSTEFNEDIQSGRK